ncbi:protein tyrosine phosphatase [Rhodobacterales bacterium LSUCC0031]|nr:protein tyrosine phosphatase [Rhodobacterales bacterium LSUCC0031]
MVQKNKLRQLWRQYLRPKRPEDISTAKGRRRVLHFMRWHDHGILRSVWHNQHQIAPGVWRSNYPDAARIAKLSEMGLAHIITLRGDTTTPWLLLEQEACARHAIGLHAIPMRSAAAPQRETLETLIDLFRKLDRPILIHCKSGADRTGLASAIYLMVIEDQPLAVARRMLSLRYLHAHFLKAGVLDMLLDDFAASGQHDFAHWVTHHYDAADLQARFDGMAGR